MIVDTEKVSELFTEMREQEQERIRQIGKACAKLRDEAIKGRKVSGVEKIWLEDREYYEGIDDMSRSSGEYSKSSSPDGVLEQNVTTNSKCTAFFNLTRQFCDSASARMGDILLPAGDWNWHVKPTPIPDDIPAETKEEAEEKVEKGEDRIKDWLVECHYHTEVRRVLEDSAIVGTGVLKGPVPILSTAKLTKKTDSGVALIIEKKTTPASFHVKPENFFPDPSCGDNIHRGSYVFERDDITAKTLTELKQDPLYLSAQIDLVLDEGPGKKNYSSGIKSETTNYSDSYEIWYGYCMLSKKDVSAAMMDTSEVDKPDDLIPVVITLVNDTVIKAALNPLDSGEFPFDVMPWQRQEGKWAGIGVARQGRTPQEMLNASTRVLMENAGLGGSPQLIIREELIRPADGSWDITRGKVWIVTERADVRSVSDAITTIDIPIIQNDLSAIIQLAYKMMEDSTGILFIMQGQQGSAPDTVGGMEILQRNSSAILRRLARTFDESITEPHIRRYYEHLLMYGSDDEKGDMQINAIGSTALVEREINAMQAQQLLQASLNPTFGIDPEKAMEEVLKSQRFISDKWLMSDAKKKENAQNQPMIPQLEVAKLKSEAEQSRVQAQEDTKRFKIKSDMDRDQVYSQGVARRDEMSSQKAVMEMQLKKELAMLDYANKNQISLDKVKADLAQTTMKLQLQEKLSMPGGPGGQVSTPLVEPPGRAPDGESYQK